MSTRIAVLALSLACLTVPAAEGQVHQVATATVAEPVVSPQCSGGVVYDDGNFNVGYTVGPGDAAIVMKLNLPAGTTTLDQACICFFRNTSGFSSMDFDVVVFDDDGPSGQPGTPVASIPVTTNAVSTAPQFFSVNLTGAGIALPNTSVYVGARFPGQANIFMCGDTSGTTTQRTNFGSGNGGASWTNMTTLAATNPPRAMAIRVDPGTTTPSPCVPSATAMCLNNNRFRVSATFLTPGGQSGNGQVVKLTEDTGYLWFFSATNVEVVVKVLNACGLNNRYWVFAGGLTNVRTTVTVTDTQTGTTKTYTNPQSTPFQPIQDTAALPTCP